MRPRSLAAATAVAAVAAVLAGCGGGDNQDGDDAQDGGDPTPVQTGLQTLTLDGSARTFLLYAPAGYDPETPAPLVLVLHGQPGSAYGIAGASGMNDVADEEGFLVAYPDNIRDIGQMRDLVAQLTADLNVAPGAIYATGFSAGGSMSWQLAVTSGTNLAAIASVLGPFYGAPEGAGSTASALQVVGTADTAWLRPVDEGLVAWRDWQGCADAEPSWLDDDERVSRTVNACRDGTELVEYRVTGLSHRWPATLEPGTPTSRTIWDFFAAHQRG